MFNKHITLEERLSILGNEDRFRDWQSLDDKRFCILCERTFDGRQVEIRVRRGGRPTLHCPTEDCRSTPRHWVRPGNPLVSDKVYHDWSLALGFPKKQPPVEWRQNIRTTRYAKTNTQSKHIVNHSR